MRFAARAAAQPRANSHLVSRPAEHPGTMTDTDDTSHPGGEFLVYVAADGVTRVEVRLADGTVWLTPALMADLYGVTPPTVYEHLGNLFEEEELVAKATTRKFRVVR